MEPKFTPGPWEVDSFFQEGGHATWIGKTQHGVPYQTIAEAFHDWETERLSWRAAEANAHLIAAAPELYEALALGEALIAGESVGSEWKRGCAEFLKASRAALAKSRGETE